MLYEKAKVMFSIEKYKETVSYAVKTTYIEPEHYLHIALAMQDTVMSIGGLYDEALDRFEKALSCKRGYEHALLCKVQVLVLEENKLLSKGKRDDALVCYRRALRIKPDFEPAVQAVKTAESSVDLK